MNASFFVFFGTLMDEADSFAQFRLLKIYTQCSFTFWMDGKYLCDTDPLFGWMENYNSASSEICMFTHADDQLGHSRV